MRRQFTLYKEATKTGLIWYARFWDEAAQKYNRSRSTGVLVEGKKERRYEAEEAARNLLPEIEKDKAAQAAKGLANAQINTKAVADTPLIEYLDKFWTNDSQYANYKRYVEKSPLSLQYIENNHEDIRRHVEPYPGFAGTTVGTLTKPMLREWLIWLAARKSQYRKHDGTVIEKGTMSSRRANTVLQGVRVAIRWAFDNEKIPADPFHKLGEITDTPKEKGVLTFAERQRLDELPIVNSRYRLVMLLGSRCGLRRGEMRGLKWGDIGNGLLDIKHNYVNKEGMKGPKWRSYRKVPIISSVEKLLNIAYADSTNQSPEGYIFESPDTERAGMPVSNNYFRDAFAKETAALGITKEDKKRRVLSCHSLRHTFVTLSQLTGMSNAEVMALAGQKREATLRKYSHVPQVIDFDKARNKLEGKEENDPNIQKNPNEPKAANA